MFIRESSNSSSNSDTRQKTTEQMAKKSRDEHYGYKACTCMRKTMLLRYVHIHCTSSLYLRIYCSLLLFIIFYLFPSLLPFCINIYTRKSLFNRQSTQLLFKLYHG